MQTRTIVPLIVACSLFMQQLDSTALTTAIPAMAESLDVPVLRLHLTITSYLLALAAFLPVSGWVADKYGTRTVFRAAIGVFAGASILCGLATGLPTLLAARVLQGMGGALMVPVGRLILVRSVAKSELVAAMALMSMPSLVGPIVGPVFGGFLTTYVSWRAIFWINVPVGMLGIALVTRFIADVRETNVKPFDFRGFVLSGVGLTGTLFGLDSASSASTLDAFGIACLVVGIAALVGYVLHARRAANPILDLRLLNYPTFRANVTGGSLFRVGVGAIPFLVPLLLQQGFGYSPFDSGLVTFASAVGSLGMRPIARFVLRRFGFKPVLVWNGLLGSLMIAACATFGPTTPVAMMMGILFLGGVFRSLEFSSINALAFAEVESPEMSQATSLSQMAQRLSMSMGVAVAAFVIHHASGRSDTLPLWSFTLSFLVVAAISASSVLSFVRLAPDAGAELAGRTPAPTGSPVVPLGRPETAG